MANLNILLVEDEPLLRKALRDVISLKLGDTFEVSILEAGDGVEGLTCFHENHIDLAIINLGMPRKDGYQLIRDIRKTGSDVCIFVISGHINDMDRKKEKFFKKIKVDLCLPKPFELQHLIIFLQKFLLGV